MKKVIIGLLALTSTSAFAQNTPEPGIWFFHSDLTVPSFAPFDFEIITIKNNPKLSIEDITFTQYFTSNFTGALQIKDVTDQAGKFAGSGFPVLPNNGTYVKISESEKAEWISKAHEIETLKKVAEDKLKAQIGGHVLLAIRSSGYDSTVGNTIYVRSDLTAIVDGKEGYRFTVHQFDTDKPALVALEQPDMHSSEKPWGFIGGELSFSEPNKMIIYQWFAESGSDYPLGHKSSMSPMAYEIH